MPPWRTRCRSCQVLRSRVKMPHGGLVARTSLLQAREFPKTVSEWENRIWSDHRQRSLPESRKIHHTTQAPNSRPKTQAPVPVRPVSPRGAVDATVYQQPLHLASRECVPARLTDAWDATGVWAPHRLPLIFVTHKPISSSLLPRYIHNLSTAPDQVGYVRRYLPRDASPFCFSFLVSYMQGIICITASHHRTTTHPDSIHRRYTHQTP